MVTLTVRVLSPAELITVTVLAKVPIFPSRFMATSIVPFVPGGSIQGNGGTFAAVQPQDALTAVMVMGTAARLLKVKVKFTLTSPGLAVMDLLSASATNWVGAGSDAGAGGGDCAGDAAIPMISANDDRRQAARFFGLHIGKRGWNTNGIRLSAEGTITFMFMGGNGATNQRRSCRQCRARCHKL